MMHRLRSEPSGTAPGYVPRRFRFGLLVCPCRAIQTGVSPFLGDFGETPITIEFLSLQYHSLKHKLAAVEVNFRLPSIDFVL
jgi:hypothetical protein